MRFIDPDGMWPGPVHRNLLNASFGPQSSFAKIVTPTQLWQMKLGSNNADGVINGNQSDSREYIHGMKPKNMTTGEAKKAADNWVKERIETFAQTGDFEQLGEGLHTLMDEACPSHRDENGTPLEYNGPFSDHGSKENPDDIKKNDGKNGYITVKEMNTRFKKAETDMQETFQNALQQRAEYLKKQEEQKKKE